MQEQGVSGSPSRVKILKTFNVGDLVVVNLNPTVGDEKQKTRICLVIEAGGTPLELIIILPITEYHEKRNKYFFVPIPNFKEVGLSKASAIDCYQIRTVSISRLRKSVKNETLVIGKLPKNILDEVRKRLALILDITEQHLDDSF